MIAKRFAVLFVGSLLLMTTPAAFPAEFTIEQILSAPFASDIVAAPEGHAFAWVSDARGRRNVWLAVARSGDGSFETRALTHYTDDDGLEVSDIAFVPRRDQLLYVLGGDIEFPDKEFLVRHRPALVSRWYSHRVPANPVNT